MLKMQKAAIFILMLFIFWGSVNTLPVHAAAPMIGITDQWDGMEGDARYLGQEYRDNYSLDQKAGTLEVVEKAANGLANVFWKICVLGTQVECAIIYYAMDFNLADLVGDKLNALESALVNNVFNSIFPIAFLGVGCMLIYRLWKRDVIGGFSDIAKTIVLVCISIALSMNAASVLTLTSSLTKQVNQAVMSGINGMSGFSDNSRDFAKEASGILWTDMIHIPWMTIEFGNQEVSEADVQRLLAVNGKERSDIVDEMADNMDCFSTDRCWDRLGCVLLYLFPWVSKLIVFTLISALQLAFQAAVLLLFATAPIVLIAALLSASGFQLIKRWGGTLLDFHIDMIMLSFLLSILIWIDKLLFTMVGTYGWLIIALLQTAICVFVFIYRTKILGFMIGGRGHGIHEAAENIGGRIMSGGNEETNFQTVDNQDFQGHENKVRKEGSTINAARSTSFTEAYNSAEYDDSGDAAETKYNTTDAPGSAELNDSGYRKGRQTMSPQEIYDVFQDGEQDEGQPNSADDYMEKVRKEDYGSADDGERMRRPRAEGSLSVEDEIGGNPHSTEEWSREGMDAAYADEDVKVESPDVDRPYAYDDAVEEVKEEESAENDSVRRMIREEAAGADTEEEVHSGEMSRPITHEEQHDADGNNKTDDTDVSEISALPSTEGDEETADITPTAANIGGEGLADSNVDTGEIADSNRDSTEEMVSSNREKKNESIYINEGAMEKTDKSSVAGADKVENSTGHHNTAVD